MKKLLIIILISINLFAWEINTHRAIDKEAIDKASNLGAFIDNTGVGSENYINEVFEGYNRTYIDYVLNGEENGISNDALNQNFNQANADYKSLLEAGTILEDAQWPHLINGGSWNIGDMSDGRFLNHFYNPQVFDGNAVEWAYNAGRNLYDYTTTKETHQWRV
ncbi:hypothetical protein [Sulfurimonas sp.]|uniref:hypothetical protein n=1 Tax=Sulfurimonas sp. TaxID=2022749 RepID=UPI003D0C7AB3